MAGGTGSAETYPEVRQGGGGILRAGVKVTFSCPLKGFREGRGLRFVAGGAEGAARKEQVWGKAQREWNWSSRAPQLLGAHKKSTCCNFCFQCSTELGDNWEILLSTNNYQLILLQWAFTNGLHFDQGDSLAALEDSLKCHWLIVFLCIF